MCASFRSGSIREDLLNYLRSIRSNNDDPMREVGKIRLELTRRSTEVSSYRQDDYLTKYMMQVYLLVLVSYVSAMSTPRQIKAMKKVLPDINLCNMSNAAATDEYVKTKSYLLKRLRDLVKKDIGNDNFTRVRFSSHIVQRSGVDVMSYGNLKLDVSKDFVSDLDYYFYINFIDKINVYGNNQISPESVISEGSDIMNRLLAIKNSTEERTLEEELFCLAGLTPFSASTKSHYTLASTQIFTQSLLLDDLNNFYHNFHSGYINSSHAFSTLISQAGNISEKCVYPNIYRFISGLIPSNNLTRCKNRNLVGESVTQEQHNTYLQSSSASLLYVLVDGSTPRPTNNFIHSVQTIQPKIVGSDIASIGELYIFDGLAWAMRYKGWLLSKLTAEMIGEHPKVEWISASSYRGMQLKIRWDTIGPDSITKDRNLVLAYYDAIGVKTVLLSNIIKEC